MSTYADPFNSTGIGWRQLPVRYIILILCLFAGGNSYAHDPARFIYLGGTLTDQANFRAYYAGGSGDDWMLNLYGVNVIQDAANKRRYYVSTDPAWASLFYLSNSILVESNPRLALTVLYLMAPYEFSNFRFAFKPFKTDLLRVSFGEVTDTYFLCKPVKIYTASVIGVKIVYDRYRVNIEMEKPWSKGYFPDKNPRLLISAGLYNW